MSETTNQQREVATVFISYAREDSPAVFCSKRAHAQSGLLCRGGRRTMVGEVSRTYWRSASYPRQAISRTGRLPTLRSSTGIILLMAIGL
jgi:hypothetical protein